MKVLFSYHIFYLQKYGGISSYFTNLAKHFYEDQKDLNIICKLHKNLNLQDLKKLTNTYKINYPYFFNKIIERINNFYFSKKITIIKPNIVHYTFFNNNFTKIINTKKIINCWDLTHEKFNGNLKFKDLKKKNFEEADKIICPSFTVKKDLLNYYELDNKKIDVTYFSSDYEIEPIQVKTMQNYILYVGSRSNYKNFENFVNSYSLSDKLKKDFKLIIFGGEKPEINGLKVLEKYKIEKNKFKFVNGTNKDLKFFYKNVRLFVYPSRYEGFGIPLIESMRMGCPVISSNGGALKEIGGDCNVYFDPDNVEDIKFKLESLIYDESKLLKNINYGYERSKKFSWKKCANETYEIYSSLF
jgi:glycosyltransferase involved in cell wall biosynthesis